MKTFSHPLFPAFALLLALTLTFTFTLTPGSVRAEDAQRGDFRLPVGLQMYTIRGLCQNDLESGVRYAAEQGFRYVEPSSSFKQTQEEYRALLDRYGLAALAKNFGYQQFRTEAGIDEAIRIGKILGVKYVGVAYLPFPQPLTEENVAEIVATFNHAGERLAAEGMLFSFHNHGSEFVPWAGGEPGETLFDYIVQKTDPKNVVFEMDVCWVVVPGEDPVKLLKKYPDRFRLMHLKDTSVGGKMLFGKGRVDFPAVLQAAQEIGIECCFIEDDNGNAVETIPENLKYLESVRF